MTERPTISSHSIEGDALLVEVVSATHTLRRLIDHPALVKARETAPLRSTVEQVEYRLSRADLEVVVAGARQSGKSTFIDALLGDRRIGKALGSTLTTTFIRKADAHNYRAKWTASRGEEFAERFPDQSGDLRNAVADAEWAKQQAVEVLEAARTRREQAKHGLTRAEAMFDEASKALDATRGSADLVSTELTALAADNERAKTQIVALERALPLSVRQMPPWWAVWLLLLRVLFMLFRRRVWVDYVTNQDRRDNTAERLVEVRHRATAMQQACQVAEARAAELSAAVDAARTEEAQAKQALLAAEKEHERSTRELEQQQRLLAAHDAERVKRFFIELESLANPNGRGQGVVEIEIETPARWLPDDVVLIDAPALTEGAREEEARAWVLISDRADGCILTAELDRGVAEPTKRFLAKMREVVPHVLLVLTKMDKAFVDAVRRGGGEPWEQVEQARRIGTRRFAREIGREPETVLSIAVAAQSAIEDERSGLARRFQAEVAKLFQLLRHERALILGTRAAAVVQGCIAQTAEAERLAAAAYSERIAALEANRLPDPEVFRSGELARAEFFIEEGSERALREAAGAINDGFALLSTACAEHFRRAKKLAGILDAAGSCERELAQGVPRARSAGDEALEQSIDRVVREIEAGIFDRLREQYQLIHDVRRSSSSLPRLENAIEHVSPPALALLPEVQSSVVMFTRLRWAMGAVGIVVAAAIGTLVAPGLGTLAGAAVGPLLALVPTRAALGRRAHALVEAALERQRQHVLGDLQSQKPRIRSAIHDALERSLGRVMVRFARFIAEPLEAEQQAIDRERALLAELGEIRQALIKHDAQLGQLAHSAAQASIGLCR